MSLYSSAQQAGAQVPAATVNGPLAASPQAMLNPSAIELEANGYIEEEYFIAGLANRYTTEGMETGAIIDSGHRYRTRFIVRRPRSADAFNGTVIIEWNNVTASRDLDIDWWQAGAHLVRNGYAYIAVSAQRVGVEHLKNTRPQRYGSLDVSHDGMVSDDALSYDIFSAVARAVPRAGVPLTQDVDILGGLRADTLLATGHSQSASRLAVYLNNVHPRDPVFYGFMVHGGGGQIRDDQNVRIFKLMAETDMARRADSPQPDSHWFRQWEVAGASHVDIPFEIEYARMVALEA
ncbi:MAG: alpha/beta hydrolase domain-containing protein, partial [Pseudomonadales bacterium]|nr:alpha/beta hydrolase domain-containing protein [Pseudomonadales bacterium]